MREKIILLGDGTGILHSLSTEISSTAQQDGRNHLSLIEGLRKEFKVCCNLALFQPSRPFTRLPREGSIPSVKLSCPVQGCPVVNAC